MRLYIAEKPKMGAAIAAALPGPHVRAAGCIQTGAGTVSWCIGHLLEQVPPDEYDQKYKAFPGSFEDLPILPQQWRLQVSEGKTEQMRTLKRLLSTATQIVNAGDPGREGQLIVDEVLEFLGNRKPVLRLLLPALDPATIRTALSKMQDNAVFEPLYHAALCRQRADYQVGMSMTRGYTILARRQGYTGVLSVGRVQTPALAIVVARDLSIEAHVPSPYWSLHVLHQAPDSSAGQQQFWSQWLPPGISASAHFKGLDADAADLAEAAGEAGEDEAEAEAGAHGATTAAGAPSTTAQPAPPRPAWIDAAGRAVARQPVDAIAAQIRAAASAKVLSASRKRYQEKPPLPYELTGLQAKINATTGASIDDVLRACQSLYDAGHASYPRTDCQYLPTALLADAQAIVSAIVRSCPDLKAADTGVDLSLKSRAWDDARIGEHYGLVPTANPPDWQALSDLEKAVYDAIARRFLAQFYPPCEQDKAQVEMECAGHVLAARGRTIVSLGWRTLYVTKATATPGQNKDQDQDGEAGMLPPLQVGQDVPVLDCRIDAHTTRPPPRFTQGTLALTMKHVDRLVTDPAERAKLKAVEGIGRSATRAEIVKTLIRRSLLLEQGKALVSSPAARILVRSVPAQLREPGLTARWETALDQVAKGAVSPDKFMQAQENWLRSLVAAAAAQTLPPLPPPPAAPARRSRKPSTAGASPARKSSPARRKSAPATATPSAGPGAAPGATLEGSACPQCGKGTLRTRTVRAGQHAGKTFFGCSRFPDCKHSVWPK